MALVSSALWTGVSTSQSAGSNPTARSAASAVITIGRSLPDLGVRLHPALATPCGARTGLPPGGGAADHAAPLGPPRLPALVLRAGGRAGAAAVVARGRAVGGPGLGRA